VNLFAGWRDQCVGAGGGITASQPGCVESVHALVRARGDRAVRADCRKSLGHRARPTVAKAIVVVLALAFADTPASAQNGIFDTILGGRPSAPAAPPVSAYADPFSAWNLFGSPGPQPLQPLMDTSVAYCVRLCDGRFFPVQRHEGAAPEQTCSSFCPATRTKIYSGASIDQAVAADGRRYADLSTAFAYREKLLDGCTCNGRTAFGLVNTSVKDDPTLRAGDIVATNGGLMVYNSGVRRQNFTPVAASSAVPADLRRKLSKTKIAPALATTAPPADVKQGDNAAAVRKNKRVQLER
jgi:hypothetical protein